jgi:transposase
MVELVYNFTIFNISADMPWNGEYFEHGGRRVGAGRYPLLTSRQLSAFRSLLIKYAGMGTQRILKEVKKRFHIDMPPRTFRRYAALVNAPYVRIPIRPPLSDRTRQKRLLFARNHQHDIGWLDVVCADEAQFTSKARSIMARIPRGAGISRPRFPHPLSVNVWWAASGRYVAEPVFYTETLTGGRYADILCSSLRPLLQRSHSTCRLLQDNLPVHYTAACRQFYDREDITVLRDFPPYSPDLQPIENWFEIAKLEVDRLAPTTQAELRAAVRKGLKKATVAIRSATLLGMPRRLKFVLENNGTYSGH